mmetsp:Transcript_26044/g.38170  ORF Transcript_26044/g.38170 Transcript_26044/m.38170 type:complete len:167 (+) Transcript_26044:46-546(+)
MNIAESRSLTFQSQPPQHKTLSCHEKIKQIHCSHNQDLIITSKEEVSCLYSIDCYLKTHISTIMTKSHMGVKNVAQERVEKHQNEASIPQSRQTEEAFDNGGISQRNSSRFVKMTTLKKSSKSRYSTEYHIIPFIPCFEEILAEIDIEDFSDEDDSEGEEEDDDED